MDQNKLVLIIIAFLISILIVLFYLSIKKIVEMKKERIASSGNSGFEPSKPTIEENKKILAVLAENKIDTRVQPILVRYLRWKWTDKKPTIIYQSHYDGMVKEYGCCSLLHALTKFRKQFNHKGVVEIQTIDSIVKSNKIIENES